MTDTEQLLPPEDAVADDTCRQQRDRSLLELQTGRNLQKVVGSIERFLLNQIDRLEHALQEGQRIEERGNVVHRLVSDLDAQREQWEQQRQKELDQLADASEKLVEGWQKLEDERRTWLAEREQLHANKSSAPTTATSNGATSDRNRPTTEIDDMPARQRNNMPQQSQWEQLQREMQMHVRQRPRSDS